MRGTPRKVGRYELVAEIGRGGMGVVYKARDPLLRRLVALKLMRPELRLDTGLVARFLQEARHVAALDDHPNIVTVHDVGGDGVHHFFTMQLVNGTSLAAALRVRGAWPLARLVAMARDVAGALEHAHRRGIVHRDVKPTNVLIDTAGRVRVTDFGIAKALEGGSAGLATGMLLGTPDYMSPEQAEGRPVDGRSDVYSLGVLLYELATGTVPFRADTPLGVAVKHLKDPPPPPREVDPALPPSFERVILKALEKDPARRHQTAAALAGDLTSAAAEAGISLELPPGAETLIDPATVEAGGRSTVPVAAPAIETEPDWDVPEPAPTGDGPAGTPSERPLRVGMAVGVAAGLFALLVAGAALGGLVLWPDDRPAAVETGVESAGEAPAPAPRAAAEAAPSPSPPTRRPEPAAPPPPRTPERAPAPSWSPSLSLRAVEFDDVKLLVTSGDRVRETDVRLTLEADRLAVYDEESGRIVKAIQYANLRSAAYSYSKHPRWKAGAIAAAGTGVLAVPLFFMKSTRHWLTVQSDTDFAVLRLDKDNYRLVVPALEIRSGLAVESISDEEPLQD